MLLDGLEGVAQVEVRHVTAEDHTGNTGEVVVQTRPDTGVDDFLAEVVRHVEVSHRVHVSERSSRIEPVNIKVDLVRAEEGAKYLGHRRRKRAVR